MSPRRHFVFLSTPPIGSFGLGVASEVALAVALVFFSGFCNVSQGLKEVRPVILAGVCE